MITWELVSSLGSYYLPKSWSKQRELFEQRVLSPFQRCLARGAAYQRCWLFQSRLNPHALAGTRFRTGFSARRAAQGCRVLFVSVETPHHRPGHRIAPAKNCPESPPK